MELLLLDRFDVEGYRQHPLTGRDSAVERLGPAAPHGHLRSTVSAQNRAAINGIEDMPEWKLALVLTGDLGQIPPA